MTPAARRIARRKVHRLTGDRASRLPDTAAAWRQSFQSNDGLCTIPYRKFAGACGGAELKSWRSSPRHWGGQLRPDLDRSLCLPAMYSPPATAAVGRLFLASPACPGGRWNPNGLPNASTPKAWILLLNPPLLRPIASFLRSSKSSAGRCFFQMGKCLN